MEGGREIARARGGGAGGCGWAGGRVGAELRKTVARAWRRAVWVRGLGSGYGIPPGGTLARAGWGGPFARARWAGGRVGAELRKTVARGASACLVRGLAGVAVSCRHLTPLLVLARVWPAGRSHLLYIEMLLLSRTLPRAPAQLTQPSWRPPPWPPWAWRCRASCAWGGRPSTCTTAHRARGASTQYSSWRSRCQSPCAT